MSLPPVLPWFSPPTTTTGGRVTPNWLHCSSRFWPIPAPPGGRIADSEPFMDFALCVIVHVQTGCAPSSSTRPTARLSLSGHRGQARTSMHPGGSCRVLASKQQVVGRCAVWGTHKIRRLPAYRPKEKDIAPQVAVGPAPALSGGATRSVSGYPDRSIRCAETS